MCVLIELDEISMETSPYKIQDETLKFHSDLSFANFVLRVDQQIQILKKKSFN